MWRSRGRGWGCWWWTPPEHLTCDGLAWCDTYLVCPQWIHEVKIAVYVFLKFVQKYFINKRLRTEELLHNLWPNYQRSRFLELFTLPCDKCPPIKCKFLNSKSIRLCNGWYSWYSCSQQELSQILCYIVLFHGSVRSNVLLYRGSIQISLHQTSAVMSPMFWFQPRPPPRWPVANGRRITKAVNLKNTISTLDFIKKTNQVAKTATRLVRQLNLSRFYQLAMKFHLRLWAQTAAHLLTARAASMNSKVAKLQNSLSWYWSFNHLIRQAVSSSWGSKQSCGLR